MVDAPIEPDDISVVIPVRNNAAGLHRAIRSLDGLGLLEIIVVDSASRIRVQIEDERVRVIRETVPGAARARNAGWRLARGCWVLFMDSDCIATSDLVTGFQRAKNGAIAYAGVVKAIGRDRFSRYYDTQQTLVPPPTDDARPAYLVTANALVWRLALERVSGFDANFPIAGGEDIDLAYRLLEVGELSFAPEARMLHDFEPGVVPFVARFVRYGRGNRMLERKHGFDHRPTAFAPVATDAFNVLAAGVQYAAMLLGYALESHARPRAGER